MFKSVLSDIRKVSQLTITVFIFLFFMAKKISLFSHNVHVCVFGKTKGGYICPLSFEMPPTSTHKLREKRKISSSLLKLMGDLFVGGLKSTWTAQQTEALIIFPIFSSNVYFCTNDNHINCSFFEARYRRNNSHSNSNRVTVKHCNLLPFDIENMNSATYQHNCCWHDCHLHTPLRFNKTYHSGKTSWRYHE